MKLLSLILVLLALLSPLTLSCEEWELSCKSVILMEAETGQVLYEKNADEPLPPASVTKIMTVLLVMEAIDAGRISLSDMVSVSANAASMGGSQVYLEPGEQMSVDELLKCVIVASANDAATALAEYCKGSEEAFVAQMNERAKELGMVNTHFENTNGLDDTATNHYTSARDIAIMSRELLLHPRVLNYTGIWMDTIRNGSFGLTNTNRLIRYYKGANGLKTGSTSKAGFCISASAKREDMQLIAVVMASPTRDDRNQTAVKLLDFGFANYTIYKEANEDIQNLKLPVKASQTKEISLYVKHEFQHLIAKQDTKKIERSVTLPESLNAPILAGQVVGEIVYTLDQKEICRIPICAKQSAKRLSFTQLLKIAMENLSIL